MTDGQLDQDWQRLCDAAERLKNWGKWGEDDQAGTVNYITPEMIRGAAALVTDGKVISLSIDYGETGPQSGHLRRFNPMSFMMRDGDDAYARALAGTPQGIGAADDILIMAAQGATHWDALGHMFFDSKMWNGYDARLVCSTCPAGQAWTGWSQAGRSPATSCRPVRTRRVSPSAPVTSC
jgi:hypothetical protein